MPKTGDEHDPLGLGGFVRGVRDLLDLLARLPEDGRGGFRRERIWQSPGGRISAIQSWEMKIGLPSKAASFAGLCPKQGQLGEKPIVEPLTDLFTGPEDVTIVCELPGVAFSQIGVAIVGKQLTIKAANESCLYEKTMLLPCAVTPDTLVQSYHQGLLKICLTKADGTAEGGLDNA